MAQYFNHAVPEPPPLNEKLLDCVLKHIEEHPEQHNQNIWIDLGQGRTQEQVECGTAACVAGWACLLTLPPEVSYADFCEETPYGCQEGQAGKTNEHVRHQARRLLGLTEEEAGNLFQSASGSKAQVLATIKQRVAQIKRNRGLGDPK